MWSSPTYIKILFQFKGEHHKSFLFDKILKVVVLTTIKKQEQNPASIILACGISFKSEQVLCLILGSVSNLKEVLYSKPYF